MPKLYVYAVTYDLGFAPNPFGGLLSLACCKPNIRERAEIGDWIVGLTGTKLKPTLRCVFAMVVTGHMTFDQYWGDAAFTSRRPRRNGSRKAIVGDNIYHRSGEGSAWLQEDSVHSQVDGLQCDLNTAHDTRINRILLSERFIYFGNAAEAVPASVLAKMDYAKNSRDYRRFNLEDAQPLLSWLEPQMSAHPNAILGDPINFDSSAMRFSASLQRMI